MSNSFGLRLRAERERLGLTQEQFAAIGGLSRLAQYKYETGQSYPTVEYLEALRNADIDAYYLLTGKRLCALLIDWDLAEEAFGFVHKHFTTKPGKSYSAQQLFEVFKRVLTTMLEESAGAATSNEAETRTGEHTSQEQ